MLDDRRIAICTPVHRYLEPDFTGSLLKTFNAMQTHNIAWLNVLGQANLAQARNTLVAASLQRKVTDVVFIDSDIGWEPEAFFALFEAPAECRIVAGAPQRRDHQQVTFCSMPDTENPKRVGRLISGMGATAFARIDAQVFHDLRYPDSYVNRDGPCKAWFDYKRDWEPTHTQKVFIDEDYFFAMACKKEGIEPWIDPTIRLRHHNAVPLTACMQDHLPSGISLGDDV